MTRSENNLKKYLFKTENGDCCNDNNQHNIEKYFSKCFQVIPKCHEWTVIHNVSKELGLFLVLFFFFLSFIGRCIGFYLFRYVIHAFFETANAFSETFH